MDQDIYGLTGVAKSAAAFVSAEPKKPTKPPKKSSRKKKTPPTKLEQLNAEVIRLSNIRSNDKVIIKATKDANSGKITLEELDTIDKKWADENGLTAAIEAYEAEKKKSAPPKTTIDIEAKKADIEKRRTYSLNNIQKSGRELTQKGAYYPYGYSIINGSITSYDETGKIKRTQEKPEYQPNSNTEKLINWINTKYDEELAALEEQPTDIENDEYNNFIDNGVVTKERIQSIANKIKNNEKLTPREMEIFSDKTSEINAEIASQMPTTKVDIEVAKDLLRQLIRGKVITEFTPDEQKILGDPSIITQELRDTLTKEFNDSKPEVVKGSVIRMTNGELVQVKNITKGKITVVPLMDDTAAEDVIDEADITDRQIVASPAKKKTVKTTPDVDTKEVIDDSVTQANGLAASKDDQAKLANEAKEMTPEERLAAVKGELRNRCNTGTKKKK
jgi:hypothetical protein